MSIKTVNEVISRILRESAPKVVAIKGAWGCGKTHAWQNLIADLRGECHRQEYSYASLFGITSINQLRIALFANTQAISINAKSADEYVDPLAIRIRDFRRSSKQFNDKIKAAIDHLPFGKIANIAIDSVLPFLLKDKVICLDDFERMGKSIEPDELLGFISELKEQNNCQVVLIFNEEKLTETQKKVYQDYREKVIDIELVYAPTVDEAIQIALPEAFPCRAHLAVHIKKLKIRNIRILFKLVELMELIYPAVAHLCQEVLDQLARTLVLLVWLEYGDIDMDERPNQAFYQNWNRTLWTIKQKYMADKCSAQELVWDEFMSNFGISHLDDFDRAIYKVICHGYLEDSNIEQCAQQLNLALTQSGERRAYSQAWNMIHESFDDNEQEAIQSVINATRERIHLISTNELDGTMVFLRQFDMDDVANELLELFIAGHQHLSAPFNVDEYRHACELCDPVLLKRFAEVYADKNSQPSLEEAILQMDEEDAYTGRNIQLVRQASQADFYTLFKRLNGPRFKARIQVALEYSQHAGGDTPSPAQLALQQIASETRLNAFRTKKFGV